MRLHPVPGVRTHCPVDFSGASWLFAVSAPQMMLFGLLLWQNPVLAVEDWLVLTPIGFSFEESGVWHWVRLGRDLCQFTGMQVKEPPGCLEGNRK